MTSLSARLFLPLTSIVFLLSGCSFVRSDVTRFDQLPSDTVGANVVFLPLDEQKTSVAYQTYADRIATERAKHGMKTINNIAQADYAVVMAYGVGGGREVSGSIPLYGQTGGGTTFHSGSISTFGTGGSAFGTYEGTSWSSPTYGMVGTMPYSRTEYDRYFTLRMIDLKRSTKENIVPVYEGTVVSTGRASSFDQVAGCMLLALFEDFRQSGSDRVYANPDDRR